MSVGLRELHPHELNAELERVLMPRLADDAAHPGAWPLHARL